MTDKNGNSGLPPILQTDDVWRLLETGERIKLLDVRTPAEFESVHIRGAYNVPLGTLAEYGEELRRHVDEPLVLVCRSGQRARQAERELGEAGLEALHVLDGGMVAWEASSLPVERGRQRLSLERQVRIAAGGLAAVGGILALTVHPAFAAVPVFIGGGLVFAGVTDTCGMALLLARLPYNRVPGCDVSAVVSALRSGAAAPVGTELEGGRQGTSHA